RAQEYHSCSGLGADHAGGDPEGGNSGTRPAGVEVRQLKSLTGRTPRRCRRTDYRCSSGPLVSRRENSTREDRPARPGVEGDGGGGGSRTHVRKTQPRSFYVRILLSWSRRRALEEGQPGAEASL